MKKRCVLALVASAFALVACSGSPSSRDTEAVPRDKRRSAAQEAVTASRPALVCTERSVRATVDAFLAAYNNGESKLVDRFIAQSRFLWYGDVGRRSDYQVRSTLASYFATRHAEGDQLVLDRFSFAGYNAPDRTGNFNGILLRRNLQNAARAVPFKGAIDCESDRIMVWSVGD